VQTGIRLPTAIYILTTAVTTAETASLFSIHIFLTHVCIQNRDLFGLNSDIHKLNTRYNNDIHLSSAQLKLHQKGVFLQELKHTATFL
jgi:hypothetical protein